MHAKLRGVLPEGFKWIDCQITGRADSLQVRVADLTSQNIELDFGLFKTQEYFRFDALATVPSDATGQMGEPPDVKLRDALRLDCRIADTRGIRKLRLRDLEAEPAFPPRARGSAYRRFPAGPLGAYSLFFSSLSVGFITVALGVGAYFFLRHVQANSVGFEIAGPDNHVMAVKTWVKGDRIELYNREGFSRTMSLREFDQLPKTTVLVPASRRLPIVASSVYVLLGLLLILVWTVRYARIRRYRRVLHLAMR